MAVLSLGFMWKSAEFNIGWIPGQGPGGGAFTFWLGVGMLICAATILIRWFLGVSPLSRSTAIYMDFYSFRMFLIGVGSLAVTIGLFHVVGVYVALPLFLMFYLRVVGRHSWRLSLFSIRCTISCFSAVGHGRETMIGGRPPLLASAFGPCSLRRQSFRYVCPGVMKGERFRGEIMEAGSKMWAFPLHLPWSKPTINSAV
jgi:hypothetical protein